MSQRRKQIAWGSVIGVVGMLLGAFGSWSATERRLSIHIAKATERVAIMCDLAEYQAAATEKMCDAVGTSCPRPATLNPEVLSRRCEEK